MSQPIGIVAGDDLRAHDQVLIEALRRARQATVHVVHVLTEDEVEEFDGDDFLIKLDAAIEQTTVKLWDRVNAAGIRCEGLDSAHVSVHVRVGDPVVELQQVCVDYDADLLIVGAPAAKRGIRAHIGSIADALIHEACLPVLVARPRTFEGWKKTERPDPPDPTRDLHEERILPRTYSATRIHDFVGARPMGLVSMF